MYFSPATLNSAVSSSLGFAFFLLVYSLLPITVSGECLVVVSGCFSSDNRGGVGNGMSPFPVFASPVSSWGFLFSVAGFVVNRGCESDGSSPYSLFSL